VKEIFEANFSADGSSSESNASGMRPMQAKVFEHAGDKFLLIKAPPASGKSRALMYVALEKMRLGQVKKTIVAVPERSIGSSFSTVYLSKYGFHSDWLLSAKYDLCAPGGESGKVNKLIEFLASTEQILVCTHATLRFAFEKVDISNFDDALIAIDEVHHVSVNEGNRLGSVLRQLISRSRSQIVAMTGSYFRGDTNAILTPQDEELFSVVSYNYFDQLNGYKHLKSLGISYSFYSGAYTEAIQDVVDVSKKTIIHIPSVNSGESLKEKYFEVDQIVDALGDLEELTQDGIMLVRTAGGKILKVADLVNDEPKHRESITKYLRQVSARDDLDVVIALGMAKEGFDWPFCEVALTVGYRGSLTEIVQIIGRTTRDSVGKTRAEFVNLVAEPDDSREEVSTSVNNVFKAIAASLLMEDVLSPQLKFGCRDNGDEHRVVIRGFMEPPSKRVQNVVDASLPDIKAQILQNAGFQASLKAGVSADIVNRTLVPKIIREAYPEFSPEEVTSVVHHYVASTALTGKISRASSSSFSNFGKGALNVDDLNIDLIYKINPIMDKMIIIRSKGLHIFVKI
jgi:superfamily II DNA or RNA helicase